MTLESSRSITAAARIAKQRFSLKISILNSEKVDFVLIGNGDGCLANLPLALSKAGFKVRVIAPEGTSIYKSQHVVSRRACPGSTAREFVISLMGFQDELVATDATFLWCSDEIMRIVSESKLDIETKLHILPIKKAEYFGIFDSKTEQTRLFQEFGYLQPQSFICKSASEYKQDIFFKSGVAICKGDSGGGGAFIRKIPDFASFDIETIPDSWFPLVFQEFIPGEDISVEAYYKNGKLMMGLCSKFLMESNEYGPSLLREYSSSHFKHLNSILRNLGEDFEVNGFANITFRKSQDNLRYYLIEFDVRPNVWHGFFQDLSIDLKSQYKYLDFAASEDLRYQGLYYEPERLFNFFAKKRNLLLLNKIISRKEIPGFGKAISSHFAISNSSASSRILKLIGALLPLRRLTFKLMILAKQKSPATVAKLIDESALKPFLIKIMT